MRAGVAHDPARAPRPPGAASAAASASAGLARRGGRRGGRGGRRVRETPRGAARRGAAPGARVVAAGAARRARAAALDRTTHGRPARVAVLPAIAQAAPAEAGAESRAVKSEGAAPPAAPAGWSPDESGHLRYWDGSAWTPHVAPMAQPAAASAPAPSAAATAAVAASQQADAVRNAQA
ncbi:DUF2510 domain-containing protein, partial [Clavibacter michiganensis]|uniref:DUF2510 domain-containing protein n=1 Tax=Clavibacter michiganensis TaxID=28447 RepID=UPI00292F7F64